MKRTVADSEDFHKRRHQKSVKSNDRTGRSRIGEFFSSLLGHITGPILCLLIALSARLVADVVWIGADGPATAPTPRSW